MKRKTVTTLFKELKRVLLFFDTDYYPIFVCGVAGCGNTLLSSLFEQNYVIAGFANESAKRMPCDSPFKIYPSHTYTDVDSFIKSMSHMNDISETVARRYILNYYRKHTSLPKKSNIIIDKAPNVHMVRTRQLRKAFPQSKFVLVFRNPLSHIEGLRRKWPLFAGSNLEEVCKFWEKLHILFLKNTKSFTSDVIGVSYETLVKNTDDTLEKLSQFTGLQRRQKLKSLHDKPNIPGVALRNVSDGKVHIVKNANRYSIDRLARTDYDYISQTLTPLYEQMISKFE